MKRSIVLVLVLLVLSQVPVFAADVPKVDVFGGFSWMSQGGGTGTSRFNPVGWQAALQGNLGEQIGIVADFGGQYKSGLSQFEYLFGPRYNRRMEKTTVFAHALFGGTRASAGTLSANAFTMGYGGGIDVKANDMIAIRVLQFDWLPMRSGGVWGSDNIRFGFGVVFNGKK